MDFQFIVATENGFRRRTEVEIEPVFSINKNAKDISVDDIVNKDIISVEIKNENKVLDIIANAGIKDIEVVKEMILNLKKNGNYEIALSEGVDVYVSPWEPQQMEDLIPTPRAASNDFVLDEMFEFLTASCSHLVYEQTIILKSTKLILNIISKNKIDDFTPNELYTNINLVAVIEISIGLFVLWVLSLIVVYTTSVICDRIGNKKRKFVTCDINSDVAGIDITKDTSSYNNVLTPVEAVSEVKEPSIVTYEIESNNVEPEVIEEVSNVDTNVGTDDVKENNSNVVTFDDILNGRIPVNYYENVLSVDEHDIVNPQEVFENKYKEYKEKSNIESFQDIVNDANEDKVVIIKNNKAKDNLRINTVTLDSLEDKNDIVDTMVTSESSGNENISEVTNELDNTGKIDVVTSNEEIRKDSYSLDDYKKFIAMLGELKDFTNSNNVSIDDAVTISLINNYSIDDCLKFKEILESNLN